MEFYAIIGNPPYQRDSGALNATNIYLDFFALSIRLDVRHISLIMPSRWMFNLGQSLDHGLVLSLLRSDKFAFISHFPKSKMIFPTVDVGGGVAFFLYSQEGTPSPVILDQLDIGSAILDDKAAGIIGKITAIEGDYIHDTSRSFASLVSPRHLFDDDNVLNTNWTGFSLTKDDQHPIDYYFNKNLGNDGHAYISYDDVHFNKDYIRLHKVLYPLTYGDYAREQRQVIAMPFHIPPPSACSATFMTVADPDGGWDSETCESVISYMRSRLFRYLLSLLKPAQNATRQSFRLIPLVPFNRTYDDEYLFERYGLDDDMRRHIEKKISDL